MPKAVDLTGLKFGRLLVEKRLSRNKSLKYMWSCRCDCGAQREVNGGCLVSGNTTSCGCYLKERITKHGGTGKGSYNTWRAMVRRCTNPKDKDYERYGAKGVRVCPEWLSDYSAFAVCMGEPQGADTLDRIDTYGDYTPQNCRWASPTQQARNIRHRKNHSGFKGVHAYGGGRFLAYVTARRVKYYGTVRNTVEEAVADRKHLEEKHWGHHGAC